MPSKTFKVLITVLFLGFLSSTYAQTLDIGIQLGRINKSKYDNKFQSPFNFYDTAENQSVDNNIFSFHLFADIKKDTTKIYRFKVGYEKIQSRSASIREASNGSHSNVHRTYLTEIVHFELGMGREIPFRISRQHFVAKFGLGFPISYQFNDTETRNTDLLSKGIDTILTEQIWVYPKTYTVGVNFFSSVQYNFYNKLWFGFELVNGLHYFTQKGTTELTYNFYDPVSKELSDTDLQTEDLNSNGVISSLLNLSLNLTYRF